MKKEYWDVTDAQLIEKTGQPFAYWIGVLDSFGAMDQSSAEVVNHLQKQHHVPRYWARTLCTRYQKGIR